MNFVVIFALSSLLLVAFVTLRKRAHPYEHAFVWMAFVFVFVTVFDIAAPRNSQFVKVSGDLMLYVAQRLWELFVIPLAIMLYFDWAYRIKTWTAKIASFLVCYLTLCGLGALAVWLKLFQYLQFKPRWSWIAWFVILCFAMLLQKGARMLLRREGIRT